MRLPSWTIRFKRCLIYSFKLMQTQTHPFESTTNLSFTYCISSMKRRHFQLVVFVLIFVAVMGCHLCNKQRVVGSIFLCPFSFMFTSATIRFDAECTKLCSWTNLWNKQERNNARGKVGWDDNTTTLQMKYLHLLSTHLPGKSHRVAWKLRNWRTEISSINIRNIRNGHFQGKWGTRKRSSRTWCIPG